jgi:hypothetical protein
MNLSYATDSRKASVNSKDFMLVRFCWNRGLSGGGVDRRLTLIYYQMLGNTTEKKKYAFFQKMRVKRLCTPLNSMHQSHSLYKERCIRKKKKKI